MNRFFETFPDLSGADARALWAGLSARGGTLTSGVQVLDTPPGTVALDVSTPRLRWLTTTDGQTQVRLTLNVLEGLPGAGAYPVATLRTVDGEVRGEGLQRVFDVADGQRPVWTAERREKLGWRVQWDLTLSDPLRFAPFDVLTALPLTFDRTFFGLLNGQLRDRVPGVEGLVLGSRAQSRVGGQVVDLRELAVYATFAWRPEFPTDLNLALDGLSDVPFGSALRDRWDQSGTLGDAALGGPLPAWAQLTHLLTAAQRVAAHGEQLPVRPGFTADAALASFGDVAAQPFVDLTTLTLERVQRHRQTLPPNLQTRRSVVGLRARVVTGLLGLVRLALREPGEDLGPLTAALLGAMHLERLDRLYPGEFRTELETFVAGVQAPLVLRGLLRAAQDAALPLSEQVAAGALVGMADRLGSPVAYVAPGFTFLHEQQDWMFRDRRLPVTGEHKPVLMTAPGAASGRADLRVLQAWRDLAATPGTVPALPFDFASTLLYYWNDDKSTHTTAKSVAFKVRWTG